jgi:PPM family protein phosphatase
VRITGHVVTNAGKVRQNNEDAAVLLCHANSDGGTGPVIGVIADGMGGYECGEVASQLAADLIPGRFLSSKSDPAEALREAFVETNRVIQRMAKEDPSMQGMGTTGAAVAIKDGNAWCAWVGDSRIYLLRDNRLFRISEDHTAVADFVRRGMLTAEQARNHPDRNVLSRALGTKPVVQVDVTAQPLRLLSGDRFLLCSDGLHDLLTDEEMLPMATSGALNECGERLLQMALDRGGTDNISLVLIEAGVNTAVARTTREVPMPC